MSTPRWIRWLAGSGRGRRDPCVERGERAHQPGAAALSARGCGGRGFSRRHARCGDADHGGFGIPGIGGGESARHWRCPGLPALRHRRARAVSLRALPADAPRRCHRAAAGGVVGLRTTGRHRFGSARQLLPGSHVGTRRTRCGRSGPGGADAALPVFVVAGDASAPRPREPAVPVLGSPHGCRPEHDRGDRGRVRRFQRLSRLPRLPRVERHARRRDRPHLRRHRLRGAARHRVLHLGADPGDAARGTMASRGSA